MPVHCVVILLYRFLTWHEISFRICLLSIRPKRMWQFLSSLLLRMLSLLLLLLLLRLFLSFCAVCISFYKSSAADVVARYFHYTHIVCVFVCFLLLRRRFARGFAKKKYGCFLFVCLLCGLVSIVIYNFMHAYVIYAQRIQCLSVLVWSADLFFLLRFSFPLFKYIFLFVYLFII